MMDHAIYSCYCQVEEIKKYRTSNVDNLKKQEARWPWRSLEYQSPQNDMSESQICILSFISDTPLTASIALLLLFDV